MRNRFLIFAVLAGTLMLPQASQATRAYVLDTAGLGDVGELYLIGALQGIVNRDAPRLFLTKGAANTVYADYLEREKDFKFTRLKSLPDAVATFAAMKRADGATPLIKGLVKYPATYWDTPSRKMVNRYYNYWIAANFAAQEDLLPVIGYKDSRFSWDKEIVLTTYPQGVNVSDCASAEGWTATNGAVVCVDRGMLKITPKTVIGRHDYSSGMRIENNGRVSCAVKQVDFGRKPILKIHIPDQNSHGTRIGLTDENGLYKQCASVSVPGTCSIDLHAATRWAGTKDFTLSIDPATGHGRYVRIRSVKVCYP